MEPEFIAYAIIEVLSSFALGCLIMAGLLELRLRKFATDVHFWRAVLKGGIATILGLLVWIIFPSRSAEFSIPFVIYCVGLTLISIGAIGVVHRSIKIIVEEEEQ